MTDKPILWWRVELNAAGKILAVRHVEAAEANSKTVIYVQAWHEIDARTCGRQAYNEYMRGAQQRRRERLIAEGKCPWCGDATDRDPGKRCSVCAARDSNYSQRARDKAAGHSVPKLDKRVAIAERRQREDAKVATRAVSSAASAIRLEVLEEVRAAWRDHNTVGGFTRWIEGEITKLTGIRKAG